jgi:Domain of Unknown Function (DUF928)
MMNGRHDFRNVRSVTIARRNRLQIILLVSAIALLPSLNRSPAIAQDTRPRPDTGTPESDRTGGGTRPAPTQACGETDILTTALVPENSSGATAVEYPTFWFYIPYAAENIDSVEFVLNDYDSTTTIYRKTLRVTNTPGVIQVSLPEDSAYALEPGEVNRWYFVINCDSKEEFEPGDITLDGWIKRTSENPEFAWDGVWYDALTDLAIQYRANPEDTTFQSEWIALLDSVGLANLSTANFGNTEPR